MIFPAWLTDLLGRGRTLGLADRRGECIYSACSHYHKCYIEKSVRLARRADVVIANHALVMIQAALGGIDDSHLPTRYVFDEGHHIFDAADGAFSANLSAAETAELRRWLTGAEGRRSGRARGLKLRIEDLIANDPEALEALEQLLHGTRVLPSDGWLNRLADQQPHGPTEIFLDRVRQQVCARSEQTGGPYSMETDAKPPVDGLLDAAATLDTALATMLKPMLTLRQRLTATLEDEAQTLESSTRQRMEAVARSLSRRGEVMIGAWRGMLKALREATPVEFVDWFEVERMDGRDVDIGMRRHWLDPTIPLHQTVIRPAHGVVMTSATLRDSSGDAEHDWQAAEQRTGAIHLPTPPIRATVTSPFDYGQQTRVFIITDVRKDDLDQVAAAYRELFLASGGGALGLFTAIQRLRGVHGRIAAAIDEAGLALYAQHVDGLDLATLIDIFRPRKTPAFSVPTRCGTGSMCPAALYV